VVNTQIGFVFLANPHTGSRATTAALMKIHGSIEVAYHHADLNKVHTAYPESASCPVVFQGVRNPLDWLVSRFHCNGGTRGKWEDWLKKRPKRPIFGRFFGQTNTFARYENLVDDVARITGHEPPWEWDNEHRTPGKPGRYLDYWNDGSIAWAKQHFKSDFEDYGYDYCLRLD